MTIDSASPGPLGAPRLDAFTQAAQAGGEVYLTVSGNTLQVLGTGATPSGRSVAWVAPDLDTVSLFANALANTYGKGIASAVADQLGLHAAPGKPLSARTVALAVDMAETSRQALGGVDFVTRLSYSASAESAGFLAACRDTGIDPAGLDPARRQALDAAMQARFDAAAAQGRSPVEAATAQTWLRELLIAG